MKKLKCKSIAIILVLANIALFVYLLSNKSLWPLEKDDKESLEDVNKSITVVIYDFEHFENDVENTVNSFLEHHPNLNIIIVSDDLPYPPLELPANIKLVVLNVEVDQPEVNGLPLRFIKTQYTLFIPDGFHLKHKNGLKKLLHKFKRANGRAHMMVTGAEEQRKWPSCEELQFDYRKWTLTYSNQKPSSVRNLCTSIDGAAAVLIETSYLHKLNTVFIQPFLKALFIQSALRHWKLHLLVKNSPFVQEHQLFRSEHDRWKHERNRKQQEEKLYKKFGIKKINHKDGSTSWFGCLKQTPRCFGTIVKDVASFIYNGRWTPPCCLRNLRETTRYVLRIFHTHKVEYWLEGGSLLGAARSGDIIPWDYDVDIGMYRNDIEKIPNLKKAKEGAKVEDDEGFVWEKSREGEFYRVQFSRANHMHVDIFPFYERNGIMTKDTWFKTHRQDTEFSVDYLKPLETLSFVGMNALVPNNYKDFLEFKFGKGVIDNWRYPNSRRVQVS